MISMVNIEILSGLLGVMSFLTIMLIASNIWTWAEINYLEKRLAKLEDKDVHEER